MINRRAFLGSSATLGVALVAGAAALPAYAGSMKTASGTFEGRSNHVTAGSVTIIEEDGRRFVELGDDFSLDGGPDPRVAFSMDGKYDTDSKLGALLSLTGKQRYAIPPTFDISKYNEVVIWCEVAGVPLGLAKLK